MTVPPKFRGRLSGLCGNFNGDQIDDFRGKADKAYTDVQHFGNSWRVGGFRACSILPKDMPISHEPQCKQSWSSRIESDRFCNALKSSLFDTCAGMVDPQYYFDQCKFDMCECPNDQCHCEVLTAYARECELAGQFIEGWRDATGCRNVTSFKYGAHLSSPNRPSKPHRNDVINDVMPARTTTLTTSTTTTTTTTSTTAKPTPLPAWIMSPKSSRLGPALPGCSRKTAKYCKNGHESRRKLSRAERRRRRRKQKRRERKWRKRQKKLRRQRQRQQRKRKHRRKNKVFQLGTGVALTMDESSPEKRRLQWSSLFSGGGKGRPPFEALLNSAPKLNRANTTSDRDSTNEYEEDYLDFDPTPYQGISSSDLYQIPRNGRKRTPLPLKETTEEWERRKRK